MPQVEREGVTITYMDQDQGQGTALPLLALIEELEGETGKPIVACNAAVYWQTLRAVGIDDKIPGFGRLLADH